MYFHPKDEYIYYLGDCDIKQRLTDRSASHCGRFAPQTQPMGCAICIWVIVKDKNGKEYDNHQWLGHAWYRFIVDGTDCDGWRTNVENIVSWRYDKSKKEK